MFSNICNFITNTTVSHCSVSLIKAEQEKMGLSWSESDGTSGPSYISNNNVCEHLTMCLTPGTNYNWALRDWQNFFIFASFHLNLVFCDRWEWKATTHISEIIQSLNITILIFKKGFNGNQLLNDKVWASWFEFTDPIKWPQLTFTFLPCTLYLNKPYPPDMLVDLLSLDNTCTGGGDADSQGNWSSFIGLR